MTRRREFKVNGEAVRARRLDLGLTLADVANATDMSATFLHYLETGQRWTVTLGTAARLAAALELPTEEVAA